jgi:hypothetical protein
LLLPSRQNEERRAHGELADECDFMVQAEHHRDLKKALLQLPTWTVQQLNQLLSSNRFRSADAARH